MSIEVTELVKQFRVHQRGAGLRASLRSLVRREHVDVHAVDGASFTIAPGEWSASWTRTAPARPPR